jgi:hypothetical protein
MLDSYPRIKWKSVSFVGIRSMYTMSRHSLFALVDTILSPSEWNVDGKRV